MRNSMRKSLGELLEYRELVQYIVMTDLKVRYRGSLLGFLWTLLNPLLLTLVLWAVFSKFGRVDEENYALFLLSGLMIWIFLSQSMTMALNSIIKQRSLIQKIYVPKMLVAKGMLCLKETRNGPISVNWPLPLSAQKFAVDRIMTTTSRA